MEGLFKRIITGLYPRIPQKFSKDLAKVIKFMLKLDPKQRPTAGELLNSSIIMDKTEELFGQSLSDTK